MVGKQRAYVVDSGMTFGPQETLQFWTAGLIDKGEARKMLGIDKPEPDKDPFETEASRQRFVASLNACGVKTQ